MAKRVGIPLSCGHSNPLTARRNFGAVNGNFEKQKPNLERLRWGFWRRFTNWPETRMFQNIEFRVETEHSPWINKV